jgi:hypothetical protein
MTAEQQRLLTTTKGRTAGKNGALMLLTGNGERFVKITAKTEMRGRI